MEHKEDPRTLLHGNLIVLTIFSKKDMYGWKVTNWGSYFNRRIYKRVAGKV